MADGLVQAGGAVVPRSQIGRRKMGANGRLNFRAPKPQKRHSGPAGTASTAGTSRSGSFWVGTRCLTP